MTTGKQEEIYWKPLEANPSTFNEYAKAIGINLSQHEFVDVYGLDEALLEMLPKPIEAIILLYPLEENTVVENDPKNNSKISQNVWFTKQTVRNACGSVALIHAIANLRNKIPLDKNGVLKKFFDEVDPLSYEERGHRLGKACELASAHASTALGGQSEVMEATSKLNLHFVTFVEVDGNIYELDGRLSGPVLHQCSLKENGFLKCVAAIIQDRTKRTNNIRFSLMAIGKKE
ncbi:hypothetical protein SNEBB_006231 [Seison nebaliae]|nr:hypothetical protein SNEBB_006231 [Seison nebaliae]